MARRASGGDRRGSARRRSGHRGLLRRLGRGASASRRAVPERTRPRPRSAGLDVAGAACGRPCVAGAPAPSGPITITSGGLRAHLPSHAARPAADASRRRSSSICTAPGRTPPSRTSTAISRSKGPARGFVVVTPERHRAAAAVEHRRDDAGRRRGVHRRPAGGRREAGLHRPVADLLDRDVERRGDELAPRVRGGRTRAHHRARRGCHLPLRSCATRVRPQRDRVPRHR